MEIAAMEISAINPDGSYSRREQTLDLESCAKRLRDTGFAFTCPEEWANEISRRTGLVPMFGTDFWQKAACMLIDQMIRDEASFAGFSTTEW
jgi:hypothetical protein